MTTNTGARRAHILLDEVTNGRVLERDEIEHLRSYLPEPPKQKTLQQIIAHVDDAWAGAIENEWPDDMYCDLENWLYELHVQLQGLADAEPAKSAHPEFLDAEADYENAPNGTVVGVSDRVPWVKIENGDWICGYGTKSDLAMALDGRRQVLRWGWGE